MAQDDHTGPDFQAVKAVHPDAVRFHWHQDAFGSEHNCWMVAYPQTCGGGSGLRWVDVYPKQTEPAA